MVGFNSVQNSGKLLEKLKNTSFFLRVLKVVPAVLLVYEVDHSFSRNLYLHDMLCQTFHSSPVPIGQESV